MIEWLGQRVGVYGFGKTGKAVVEFLQPQMITPVVLVDRGDPAAFQSYMNETNMALEYHAGDSIGEAVGNLDSLVLSPGVPVSNTYVKACIENGIPVVSELELAARFCPGHIIAVTGTNGKSTTTMMLGHVLSALGPCHVVGNIGTPFISSVGEISPEDYVALEVSSFQLERVDKFKPQVAVYTNLTPDHLDRHGTMEEYARVKRSMTQNMGPDGFVITNALCKDLLPSTFENQQPMFLQYRSTPGSPLRGAWPGNGKINVDLGAEQLVLPLDCVKMPGLHNLENAMAVILSAALMGGTVETIIDRLSTFTGYEHRLELCRAEKGYRFYNDSKATNPEATITALKAMDTKVVLILGGRDKMTTLADMCDWVKRKAEAVVAYGEAAERFTKNLAEMGYNNVERVDTLEEAVVAAHRKLDGQGGTVLLSPACSSFDLYASYEQRGEHFKQIVSSLGL